MVDAVLQQLSARLEAMYSNRHPLIPPEKLLRAVVLRLLYSVDRERILLEQLRYNLLFRCFAGLGTDDELWDPTMYSNMWKDLLHEGVAQLFLEQLFTHARLADLLSEDHFGVDWMLVEEWTQQENLKEKTSHKPMPTDELEHGANVKESKCADGTDQSLSEPESWINLAFVLTESEFSLAGGTLLARTM